MSIEPLGIYWSEILIEVDIFPFKKIHLKMSSAKWRLFHLALNELTKAELLSIEPFELNFIWN